MKCQPLYFKGTEGVVELTQWFERMETVFRISNCSVENQIKFSTCTLLAGALTWWNSHVRIVGHDVAYAMIWIDLRKKMTDKYCSRNEIKKLETELWNLKVKGTDVTGYNQRFQELALLCVRMFPEESDKVERNSHFANVKLRTESTDNKPPSSTTTPRGRDVVQAYAAGTGERKEYAGTLPLCNKCKFHHNGPCTVKCANCKRICCITKLEFPQELSKVHNMFHVSNLKKCYADEPLAVLLDGLHLDDKLHFVEEPLEIVGREVKRLKRSRIPLVKVRWNSKRGPEFHREREDQFKKKYPHLFTKTTPSSSAAS
ncbi:reverse transcriptase domain-containing protein [Tanacetum coccineum]|uniref:Reverse transcriptase domain-containing protein n=1 Tax=Tanacetum coccineum TaxID=301880 RepID=A0ABQ5HYC7_9ASTR